MDLAYTGERRTGKAEEKDGAGKLYK